ncbi:uncharacterized protein LOC130944685 isoform X2 [Arachis stenosperma]|nr:uncharacterized protein LOC130944684 isoform X1 [Arachis stenosperma]XP_057729126.1 uncharacterized protein LOC130944685 isoform X2 [Arachis stenosperma]
MQRRWWASSPPSPHLPSRRRVVVAATTLCRNPIELAKPPLHTRGKRDRAVTLPSLLGLSWWLPSSLKELVAELLGRRRRRTRRKVAVLSSRAFSSILPPLVPPLSLPFENVVGRVSHLFQFCFTTVLACRSSLLFGCAFVRCFACLLELLLPPSKFFALSYPLVWYPGFDIFSSLRLS